jgi:hypothetical protein
VASAPIRSSIPRDNPAEKQPSHYNEADRPIAEAAVSPVPLSRHPATAAPGPPAGPAIAFADVFGANVLMARWFKNRVG